MKKVWSNPEVQELTIHATAHRGNHHGGFGGFGGDGNKCKCEGGISPCQNHHGQFEDRLS